MTQGKVAASFYTTEDRGMSKDKMSGAVNRIYHLQVVDKYEAEIKKARSRARCFKG